MVSPRLLVPAAALLAASGCRFGESSFTSDFSDRAFDPSGTTFSYLDGFDDALVRDEDPRVVVATTWLVFDPQGDLNDLDGASLASLSHELRLRDAMTLVFDHQLNVEEGSTYSVVRDGTIDSSEDGLQAFVHLAPERLTSSSTYAEVAPFGSRRTVTVTLDAVSFDDAQPVIAGSVDVVYEAVAGRDPGNAQEGGLHGTFRAPLVVEPTAEQNLALLQTQDILGVPLAPRAAGNDGSAP